uniref:J domain-containing protein n=1 Tax=Leersia perrieri TaxID=77586 RepID=A0A0D9VYI5_9ORYZ
MASQEDNRGGRAGGSKEQEQEQEQRPSKAWGILIFGLIGATTATFAVAQVRRSFDWVYTQLNKMQTTSWRNASSSSNRGSFRDDARKRYYQRMQQEYEEEQERVQRIRHMQSVFNRERSKFRRGYEAWRENGPPGGYNYVPRDDWYWQTDTSHSEHKNRRTYTPAGPRVYPMSHHYTVLGLDRSRTTPYTDAEVKNAFRTKAMEVHPDQNQDNREAAEEQFKEVVKSYEAIKLERKNDAS